MAAAKKKIAIPTLCERVRALQEELDEVLNELAKGPPHRGHTEPAVAARLRMDIRGGYCLCKSYLAAVKEGK